MLTCFFLDMSISLPTTQSPKTPIRTTTPLPPAPTTSLPPTPKVLKTTSEEHSPSTSAHDKTSPWILKTNSTTVDELVKFNVDSVFSTAVNVDELP